MVGKILMVELVDFPAFGASCISSIDSDPPQCSEEMAP